MKSILFFSESLGGGGAECVFENLIKTIDKSRFDVHVVSETDNELRTETVAKNSKYHCFAPKGNGGAMRRFFNKAVIKFSLLAPEKWVKAALIRDLCDIEVAFCEGYSTKIIGNSGGSAKKAAWIHTDVVNNPWSEAVFGSAEEERRCYSNFDAIICVSQTIKDSFVSKYGMADKVHVIYNIIDDEKTKKLAAEQADCESVAHPLFVLAGSMKKVKGFDRMIEVCTRLKNEGYRFSTLIMGEGEDRAELAEQIKRNGVGDTVTLMDFQVNPYKYMAAADAFVCSSYAEGYSTVVSEAVILGKPVITTECSGMREIFGDRECGIVCENSEDGLYHALKKVLDNPELLVKFAHESEKRAEEFSKDVRIKEIEAFFDSL